METNLLLLSIFFSGLMAGLFYAWSISVTPGLANVSPKSYLESFQSMNRAILNPIFFIPFMGLAILLPLVSYLNYSPQPEIKFWLTVSATFFYLVGIMGVTIFGNVPLNNQLEALNISTITLQEMKDFRSVYEGRWNTHNGLRTVASSLVMLLLILAQNQ